LAVVNYEAANGHFPPAYQLGPDGKPWHSWRVLVLPFMEQDNLFRQYRFDEPWNGPNNSEFAHPRPKTFGFADGTHSTTTNYLAVVGLETMWPGAAPRKRCDLKDAPGETILIVENNGLGVHWTEPRDLAFDSMPFDFDQPNGVSSWYKEPAVATADTRVRRLSKDTTPEALRATLTVAGGEKLNNEGKAWTIIDDGRDRERK
jgi:hypothetical protein